MGFLSSIGSSALKTAKSYVGASSGNIVQDLYNIYKQFTSNSNNTFTKNYSDQSNDRLDVQDVVSIESIDQNMINGEINVGGSKKNYKGVNKIQYTANLNTKALGGDIYKDGGLSRNELDYHPTIPEFGYDIWQNERYIWQKNLYNFFGDQGYFYFKIFFKFDTNFGLFGGIMNGNENMAFAHNSAVKYLNTLNNIYNANVMSYSRINSLIRFTKTLSYINTNAPWFFKAIRGLDKVGNPVINELSKEKYIEIECNIDSIDMRLSTMMDWYKFACYDDIQNCEVIPENLRKFDMMVLIFQSPIKKLHMPITNLTKTLKFKNTYSNSEDFMSFKLFEFIGCEIDKETISSQIPGDMNNEVPFNLGKGTIKINYDKCYQYTSNEFDRIMFGSDGILYDIDNAINNEGIGNYNTDERIKMMNPIELDSLEGISKHFGGIISEYAVNNVSKYMNNIIGDLFGNSINITSLGYLTGTEDYLPGNSEKWEESINKLTSKYEHKDTQSPYNPNNIIDSNIPTSKKTQLKSISNLTENFMKFSRSIYK